MSPPRALPLFVAGLLLGLTWLLVHSVTPNKASHESTLDALRSLDLADAALQRDVLRARAGLLRNYDPLVEAVDRPREAVPSLRTAVAIAVGDARPVMERRVEALVAALDEQERLVERFKSQNALLQNSLRIFSHVLGQMSGERGSRNSATNARLGAAANAMLRFTSDPRADAAAEASVTLDRLQGRLADPELALDFSMLVAHGQLIVATLPAVDAIVARLQVPASTDRTQAVRESYLRAYGEATARADVFRALLYAAAVGLVAYAAYLFLRLRRSASTLRQRLAFESLVASVSAKFINLPLKRIQEGIKSALALLAAEAGFDRASIVLLPAAENDPPGRTYGWCRAGVADRPGSAQQLLAIATDPHHPGRGPDGVIYVPRVVELAAGPEKERLGAFDVRAWLSLPMGNADRRLGYLMLEMVSRESPWSDDDIALLRTAAEIFANAVERARSERERAELSAKLAEAQRLESLGTLAGGIAHEFNNILGAILGHGELALAAPGPPGDTTRHVTQIMRAGARAQSIIDQILTFSRRRERAFKPFRAEAVVAETIDLLRASFPATVTLQARLAADDAVVLGDPTGFQQVAMNLCANAVQAMDQRGRIEVDLDRVGTASERHLSHGRLTAGDYVRLTVRDTGYGIDGPTMQRIVEPFFTTKPAGRGTGLGLSTVHGIVTAHGGALHVQSHPGLGSTFEAYFPTTERPVARETGLVEPPVPQGRGETILVVDDDRQLVLVGEEMLAALGYEPIGFDDPTAAMNAFRADPERFDAALADEQMPQMSGTELATGLHRVRPDLPIILMTGRPDAVDTPPRPSAEIREILRKPLRSRPLGACLARHLTARSEPARDARPSQPQLILP